MATEHPLSVELDSLKAALDKYQHAAHSSSLQLQRGHLEVTEASARCKYLEADNSRLRHESAFLRANPDTTPTSLQVSELSLALRHVSDKLSLTESTLLQRTTELAHALSENARIQLGAKAALVEVDKAKRREEDGLSRQRELERKTRAAEEEARMADVVVMEYADLVRSLEGRRSKSSTVSKGDEKPPQVYENPFDGNPDLPSASSTNGNTDSYSWTKSDNLIQSLTENRFSLQRLLHEFNSETSSLQDEISRLHAEVSSVHIKLDTERENSRLDRVRLAEALAETDRYKTDDAAAGKMVSRYMRFSQSSVDMLQTALSTLRSRHAATLTTLSSSSEALSHSLELERKRAYQLRDVLDQLTEDVSRETFGRRREIALRLRSVVREEKTIDVLNAWLRRAEEMRTKTKGSAQDMDGGRSPPTVLSDELGAVLDHMIQDARALLTSLSLEKHPTTDVDAIKDSPLERVILAEGIARSLTADLQNEIEKRMALTRMMAKELFTPSLSNSLSSDTTPANIAGESAPSEMSSTQVEQNPVSETSETIPDPMQPTYDPSGGEPYHSVPTPDPEKPPTDHSPSPKEKTREPVIVRSDSAGDSTTTLDPWNKEPILTLLAEMPRVSHRYDELQRAFRDCHLTLAKLKADVAPISLAPQTGIPVVSNVIHRLDDFCEDARVELEIRIADEERIAKGFETLLGVPGALVDDKERERVERELRVFLDGTAPQAVKANESCAAKLYDLQHDIAQIKRALHETIEAASEVLPEVHPKTPPAWSSWAPPFLSGSPSRSSSPAPTFGSVITAPRPRRISSHSFFPLSSRASSDSTLAVGDPYAHLELRIPMPSQAPPTTSPLQSSPSKLRKTSSSSGMYLLGLGSRSGFFSKQEVISEVGPEGGVRTNSSHEDEDEAESDTQRSQSDVE